MALVKISKGADIRHEYTDGVSRVPVLEGAYKDAAVERISLQPGAELSPALYSKTEHNQVFLITAGKGYIATPRRVFNITDVYKRQHLDNREGFCGTSHLYGAGTGEI